MKGNGTKLAFIVAFLVLTIYYLFPSFQFWLEMRKVDNMPEEQRTEYLQANEVRISDLRDETLTLGLDLQGGMHVTLELASHQLIRELAAEYADEEFDEVMSTAVQRAEDNNSDVITEFVEVFEERDPDARLSRYFRSDADNITRRSTNAEILEWLQNERDEAVDRAIEIVRNRVDRYGVTEPSIVRQGNNRLIVQLPGITDEERIRGLLRGTARLEFRLTSDPDDLRHSLEQIIAYYDPGEDDEDDIDLEQELQDIDLEEQDNPLLQVMIPQGQGVTFGAAASADTAEVNRLLDRSEVQRLLPREVMLMWTANPQFESEGQSYYALIGVRRQVELTGDVITEARPTFDQNTNQPEVSMSMNRQGSRTWARVTGANIGRPIAIALDGVIYSYPVVQGQITGGRSSITGLASSAEAEDLVNILMSGALPAPLDIVQERTVGPSLGEESIRSGFNSALFGLGLVVIFMLVYYRAGGAIADIALVLNIIFIMGILAAFDATLTLPGIAGIVLTIGMAVDANVLIFDRIREEQRAGKSLISAIDSGYANSMSAILDANITTFLTAVILFSFGVGPIKGFAITLMAGIAASLFSAIIITRVIVDWMTKDKKWKINYG